MELESIKQEFLEIFYDNIERDGSEELLAFLEKSDFFTAPASSKSHSNFAGGLCLHSINVYKRYLRLLKGEYKDKWQDVIPPESVAIIALLHDLCKVNFYTTEMRNVKVEDKWVQKPYYKIVDNLPYGHGEKSVYMISGFMKLTREEAMAINWHMGGFDDRIGSGGYVLKSAFYKFPTALLFHTADNLASYLDEKASED